MDPRFEYDGPPELLDAIVQALQQVQDPEVAMNIVDLGLVYGITVGAGHAHVRMTMTSAACPVTDLLADEVRIQLGDALPGQLPVEVEMVWDPPWTPERLSPAARAVMGW